MQLCMERIGENSILMHFHAIVGESGVSWNKYRKVLFISLGSPLVALERDIFRLTKGCLTSEEIEHK